MKKLMVVVVSLMTGFAGIAPAQALPAIVSSATFVSSDAQEIQYRVYDDRRNDRRYYRERDRRERYSDDRRYDRRDRRNNAGAIIGGLAAGAIIGGAIAPQRQDSSSCASRYRSYRASDNTYQPYSGPRRACR
ncbi:BA14K family protein [Rhizobium terrae]|uniref:BA14K family protein n=1 Tax=Rhizobium terrae TaxID=2171756 RepID=UPI000E3E3EF0|nr:BA14K family protein [Rhizobium terrae]